jgi:phosphopantothenoylcysteine decarboxylase/phosphopantothenate--cysteine ligase
VRAHAPEADVIMMAAAVADYRPASVADTKLKKDQLGDTLTMTLVKNPDILAGIAAGRRVGQQIIGFAAEMEPDSTALLTLGRNKIARKGADYLVINRVGWNDVFGKADNSVVMIDGAGDIVMEASGSKLSVANRILDATVRP